MYGDKDRQIIYQLLSWTKQNQLGEDYFNLLPIKIELHGKKQRQNLKHLPPPSFQSQLHSFIPDSSTCCLHTPSSARWDGEWRVVVSSKQFLSATPSFSHCSLLCHGVFHGLQGNIFSIVVSPTSCMEISAPVPAAPPPSPSSMTVLFAGLFFTLFPLTPLL